METQIKQDLANAYQILALNNMDDLTYTHLSARVPGEDAFFIYPFGMLFEEVREDNLLKVTLDGKVIEGSEYQYNQTGYIIHGEIYKFRPEINAIFHLHTVDSIAVSINKEGLLPLSQFSLHFYERMSYHSYNSLALDNDVHGSQIIRDLGQNRAMLMHNHGMLTCGSTIAEAAFYTHHLEQACRVQCRALSSAREIIRVPEDVCKQAVKDLLTFEKNLGNRDWQAMLRKLNKHKAFEQA